jgi:hypothetical protein
LFLIIDQKWAKNMAKEKYVYVHLRRRTLNFCYVKKDLTLLLVAGINLYPPFPMSTNTAIMAALFSSPFVFFLTLW